ncbi:hypothetical protein M3175_04290 [Robertmurraya korlensis]|nr:hypothetical protein [Robertmurraya korlensis]MCM3599940.1 hypothetical protein [Robertmurraya korlensis]
MNFNLNRINPNQTQVIYMDGRFETLTNEELDELLTTDFLYQEEIPQQPQ